MRTLRVHVRHDPEVLLEERSEVPRGTETIEFTSSFDAGDGGTVRIDDPSDQKAPR